MFISLGFLLFTPFLVRQYPHRRIATQRAPLFHAHARHRRSRDCCHLRLLPTVTPMRRSEICVNGGAFPALRSRRPVSIEKPLTSHHSRKLSTRWSSTARSRSF